jgi:glycerol-3-phosphate acyltransferase PlsY
MVLILSPIAFGALFVIFVLLLAVTHYVSLSSITVGLLYPFALNRIMALFGIAAGGLIILLTVLVGLLVFYCHRENIVRLKERRENRFYFRKKK